MSVFFQTGKLCLFRKSLTTANFKLLFYRNYSGRLLFKLFFEQRWLRGYTVNLFSDPVRKFKKFNDVIAERKGEARRSLVVQVNSESSFSELYGYCSKYATIKDIHHYRNSEKEHFMLIEFETEEHVKEVLKSCSSHRSDPDVMPIKSPFLWFKSAVTKGKYSCSTKVLAVTDGIVPIDNDKIFEELLNCETVSDQIQHLYERTKLNDLGIRLRYMVAWQFEVIFSSLYANMTVHPFGSSVNGCGKMGCDLDLVLTSVLTDEMRDAGRRLVYQEKHSSCRSRGTAQQLALLSSLLELRAPGVGSVVRVLAARVPILKCTHQLAGLHCDITANNTTGVHMSELLWLYGSLDSRIQPLIFVVRSWANAMGLTSPHPGPWITNFPLTLMVLFFLQQKRKTGFILPPLKLLIDKAGKDDIRIAEENINCTFLRDLDRLPTDKYAQCQDDLHNLLLQFFEFYAQFDFEEKAISIIEGVPIRKPDTLPLYIVNPLERALNVSRNVSYEECERFRSEVRNAAWHLETALDSKKGEDWGLLGLLEKSDMKGLKKLLRMGNSRRLVSVKDLFKDDVSESKSDTEIENSVKKMKGNMPEGKKEQKTKFKNIQVASEVYRIRRNKIR